MFVLNHGLLLNTPDTLDFFFFFPSSLSVSHVSTF